LVLGGGLTTGSSYIDGVYGDVFSSNDWAGGYLNWKIRQAQIPPWYTDDIIGGPLVNTNAAALLFPYGKLSGAAQLAAQADTNITLNPNNSVPLIVLAGSADIADPFDLKSISVVYYSTNRGRTWFTVANPPFSPRSGGQLVALGTDLYLFGGTHRPGTDISNISGAVIFNDLWKSVDGGVTWQNTVAHNAFSRASFCSASYLKNATNPASTQGTLIFYGGITLIRPATNISTLFNDVAPVQTVQRVDIN